MRASKEEASHVETGWFRPGAISMRRRPRMNMSLFILLALTATALVVALAKDPQLVARGLHSAAGSSEACG